MNWDRVEGNWKQLKGKVQEQWGKITDDEIDIITGRRAQLLGRMQESYAIGREQTERQLRDWESRRQRRFENTQRFYFGHAAERH